MQMLRPRFQWLAPAWLACLVFVSPVASQQAARVEATEPVDVEGLKEIEQRVLPPLMREGPAAHDNLPDYYWASNPDLRSRFDNARQVYESGETGRLRQVTLVAGSAGIGKTFLKREVFSKAYPEEHVCKFDLRELYTQWQEEGTVYEKPDLYNGNIVLNTMLAVRDKSQPLLLEHLRKREARFYVIDSLDEIHSDEYAWLLRQVEEFVADGGRDFVHVVVFGRSMSFVDYWQAAGGKPERGNVELFLLKPPKFRTTGDLMVSSWEYHTWSSKLRWAPNGGEPEPMSLEAYARWHGSGFSNAGFFTTVSYQTGNPTNKQVHEHLQSWCLESRDVGGVFYNLAGNGFLREIAERHAREGKAYQERQFKDAYFQAWLKRETDCESRPSAANPKFLDLYLELLEEVAVKYWSEGRVDENGFFPVSDVDAITVHYQGEPIAFPVRRILDHSGLKHGDPRELGVTRYRFEPIWAHRLLVEYHNERNRVRQQAKVANN